MQDAFSRFIRNKYFLLFVIICLGVFLRAYAFEKNLLFEIDQARDWKNAMIINNEGLSSLPLLGPKAGGTEFRMGPITNYIQYLAFNLFGPNPASISLPDLFFSIITLPLAYIFFRELFNNKTALVLSGLYAVSLFAVEYSRFGWNPNSIPFFILLFMLSLLKIAKTDEKHRAGWLIIFAVSAGVLVQLHTITLICIPIILILFMLWNKTKLLVSEVIIFFVVLAITFFPIITHEIFTNFQNTKAFFAEIDDRGKDKDKFALNKKLVLGTYDLAKNYQIILFSRKDASDLNFEGKSKNGIDLILRNLDKKQSLITAFLIWLFIFGAFVLIWKKIKKVSFEKKSAIKLIIIWQVVFLLVLLFISPKQDTRHYLGIIFLPFIFLGFYLEILWQRKKWIKITAIIFFVSIFFLNLIGNYKWLKMVDEYNIKINTDEKEFVLEPYFNVTLSQYESLAKHISDNYHQDKKEVRIASHIYLQRSILHLLNYKYKVPANIHGEFRDKIKHYYFIANNIKSNATSDLPAYIQKDFDVEYFKNYGTLILFSLNIKTNVTEISEPAAYILLDEPSLRWRDILKK